MHLVPSAFWTSVQLCTALYCVVNPCTALSAWLDRGVCLSLEAFGHCDTKNLVFQTPSSLCRCAQKLSKDKQHPLSSHADNAVQRLRTQYKAVLGSQMHLGPSAFWAQKLRYRSVRDPIYMYIYMYIYTCIFIYIQIGPEKCGIPDCGIWPRRTNN